MRSDWTVATAAGAIATLVAMIAITLTTGVSQEGFELARDAAGYAADLRAHPAAIRLVFAIDSAFLVLYTAFFIGFARRIVRPETRLIVGLAIGAIALTALLDMIEDHHILGMLAGTEAGAPPGPGELVVQHAISQTKFNVSYLGLFLFGLVVPRRRWPGTALALLLTVGTLIQGVWLYAAPVDLLPVGNLGRWAGFIVGFALAIAVVRGSDVRDPDGPASAAAPAGRAAG